MRREKSLFSKVVEIIAVAVIVAVLTSIGVMIYKLVDSVEKETNKNDKTASTSSFVVQVQDKELKSSSGGLVFTSSETFSLITNGADSDIFAKITCKKLPQDYAFRATKDSETWDDFSWNTGFASVEDMTRFFDVSVNQDKNTVTVKGTFKEAVTKCLQRKGYKTIEFYEEVPNVDMFVLDLTQGDAFMTIGFHVYAPVYSLTLGELSFC